MEKQLPFLLFCEDSFEPNKVDTDFEDEFICATELGFSRILFSFDDLISKENSEYCTKRIKPIANLTNVVYRGWMLTPTQYSVLYDMLFLKNYKLINTAVEYQNSHYLPDSLIYIKQKTPNTIYQTIVDDTSIDEIVEMAKIFGDNPVVIKDYVKSEKHDWETACFVKRASNKDNLKQTINNLIQLRGKYLNEGIVIREFVNLKELVVHSKSGMPLKEEYRLFFFKRKLIGIYDYWEEGEYNLSKPDTEEFEIIAQNVESNFFTMDIAIKTNGEVIVIELGDGQVSGLPDRADKKEFYLKLKEAYIEIYG